jgi:inosose dehydratase
MVLAAASGLDGYDTRPDLDDRAWRTLFGNLDRIAERARERGVTATLHPHIGTMVETRAEVERVLAGSTIPLCLDTGHLLIGGTDPVELAKAVPDRIAHTHLKDVGVDFAERVRSGAITYTDAVRGGMYRPLGAGDIDIAAIIGVLESHGYRGWYTMEQDTILTGKPTAEGPAADVRASVAYLTGLGL